MPPFCKHVQELLHFPPNVFSNLPYSWRFPWIVAAKPGTCVTDWCVPIIVAGCMVICLRAPVQLIGGRRTSWESTLTACSRGWTRQDRPR